VSGGIVGPLLGLLNHREIEGLHVNVENTCGLGGVLVGERSFQDEFLACGIFVGALNEEAFFGSESLRTSEWRYYLDSFFIGDNCFNLFGFISLLITVGLMVRLGFSMCFLSLNKSLFSDFDCLLLLSKNL